jgi:transposase
MASELRCPACGETERLHGRSTAAGIVLTCESCGHKWPRDDTPRCRT